MSAEIKDLQSLNNLFSKLILHHNLDVVPILKEIGTGSFKIKGHKAHKIIRDLEGDHDVNRLNRTHEVYDYFKEYLVINSFVVKFLEPVQYKNCLELYRSYVPENRVIAICSLYTLIEEKKKELIEKLT